MPAQYEAIRNSYVKRGKSYNEAQRLAAMTYNSLHPGNPLKPHRKYKGASTYRKSKA